MDIFYVRAAILIISIGSIVWGGMISFSERFFEYWQNNHWKESNNRQWADTSRKANRLGVGLGAFVFGIALAYFVLFETQVYTFHNFRRKKVSRWEITCSKITSYRDSIHKNIILL